VILDEVGRGTATFDGLSLAWAIVEYLHDDPERSAKVLFATHYHELTDLSRRLPRLTNRSMAVKEWGGSILFLHRVVDGPSDRSYGIHVARLAGVPDNVCRRAEDVLATLERHELGILEGETAVGTAEGPVQRVQQLDLFRPVADEILDRLGRVDIDQLTPLEALRLLAGLQELTGHER
jgi:DNA mismatch repair protein MutS